MALRVLGIDPGLGACGVALKDGDEGWFATTIRVRQRGIHQADRILRIAHDVHRSIGWSAVDILVVELMNTHDGRNTNKQDLIPLAILTGTIIQTVPADKVFLPLPSQWKGSVSKTIHHRRLKQEVPELAFKRMSKDAWDAVGLALYGVKNHAQPYP
jgi:Holliday junction resolvasome RuvABC endonuclease subunit